jgi:glycosyltransferase involved in cell wall biosynthesis
VRSQAEALQQFIPYYTGSLRVPGLSLPEERTLVLNQGGLLGKTSEVSYKLFGFAPAFLKRISKLNPALLHAHFGPNGTMALPLVQNLAVPLIVTFHGYDATVKDEYSRRLSYSYRVYLRRKELLKHEGRLFIAVSEFIKNKLLDQGFPLDKIVVHYIGVDTEKFQPDPSVQRDPIVLFVGRLVEKKGCEYLIRAMSQVQAVLPDVELVIVGDGPLRSDLEGLAAKKLRRYRFLGGQPLHIVKSWMNKAQVLAAPSVTASTGDSEGLPTVLIEAQAMGLPVVSSFHAGIPELVIHEKTGFLVAERNWEGLAKYILLLLEDVNLRHCLTQAGQNRVQTLFNLQKQTHALEEIYKEMLGHKGNT